MPSTSADAEHSPGWTSRGSTHPKLYLICDVPLYACVVSVAPDERFERRGDDLHTHIEVPVADAALGGEAKVRTLKDKTLALRVPEGTQGGKVFRLAGQGMPRTSGGFGDLFVEVRLVLPEQLTDEQRRLFEQLRASTSGAGADVAADASNAAGAGA